MLHTITATAAIDLAFLLEESIVPELRHAGDVHEARRAEDLATDLRADAAQDDEVSVTEETYELACEYELA